MNDHIQQHEGKSSLLISLPFLSSYFLEDFEIDTDSNAAGLAALLESFINLLYNIDRVFIYDADRELDSITDILRGTEIPIDVLRSRRDLDSIPSGSYIFISPFYNTDTLNALIKLSGNPDIILTGYTYYHRRLIRSISSVHDFLIFAYRFFSPDIKDEFSIRYHLTARELSKYIVDLLLGWISNHSSNSVVHAISKDSLLIFNMFHEYDDLKIQTMIISAITQSVRYKGSPADTSSILLVYTPEHAHFVQPFDAISYKQRYNTDKIVFLSSGVSSNSKDEKISVFDFDNILAQTCPNEFIAYKILRAYREVQSVPKILICNRILRDAYTDPNLGFPEIKYISRDVFKYPGYINYPDFWVQVIEGHHASNDEIDVQIQSGNAPAITIADSLSKKLLELQYEVKDMMTELCRVGKVSKAEYLQIAWDYRMRHPRTSRAKCLEKFMQLVGQPILGWKIETAAETFKRYYSQNAQGYVPSSDEDHGYSVPEDLEFLRTLLENKLPKDDTA